MVTPYEKVAEAYIESDKDVKRLFAPPPQPERETPFADFFKEKKKKEEEPPPRQDKYPYLAQEIEFLTRGMEQTFTAAGALITAPFRPPPKTTKPYLERLGDWRTWLRYYPGGVQYEAYKEWKEEGKDPHIPVVIPSWKQLGAWLKPLLKGDSTLKALGIKVDEWAEPTEYEMAQLGMAEVAEFAPLMFLGVGKVAKTALEKAASITTAQIKKGKPAEEALNIAFNRLAKKGELPKFPVPKVEVPPAKPPVEVKPPVVPPVKPPAPLVKPVVEAVTPPPVAPISPIAPRPVGVGLPVGEGGVISIPSATLTQKTFAHELAKTKNLMTKTGQMKAGYRRLAELTTGKTSMTKMTEVEADVFTSALNKLTVTGVKAPVIGKVVTPTVNEIGVKEFIRPAPRVFEKMGLFDIWEQGQKAQVVWNETIKVFEKNFEPVIKSIQKLNIDEKLWNALQVKGGLKALTPEELGVANWVKSFYNSWAERIGLPKNKKIEYYVTHLFEESKTLDPDILKMIDMGVAKEVQIPFLKKRFGIEAGLNKSVIESVRAYNNIMLKAEALNPVLKQLNLAARGAPTTAGKYLKEYTDDIAGRTLSFDVATNNTLASLGGVLGKLPGGKIFEEYLTTGNPAQKIGGTLARILHLSKLGARPASAIRNLSQQGLIASQVGPVNFVEGKAMLLTKEGRALLKESIVWRSRKLAFMPGVDEPILKSIPTRFWDATMILFRLADKDNVATAFLAGYRQATRKGLPREWAIKRGDEVAMDTQYLYTKFARAMWSRTGIGKALTPLTSWGINWIELMVKWAQGRPSRIYTQYEKLTGVTVQPTNWLKRRSAIISYAGLVSGAYFGIEKHTDIRALEYTGWTSINTFAAIAAGDIAGFDLPGGIMKVLAGYATDNDYLKNEGLYEIRPDRYITIIKQVSDVLAEKKDPISLFLYVKPSNWRVRELKKTWSDDFEEYEDIEDTVNVLGKVTKSATEKRTEYRKRNPETEAKFFLTGRFTTLMTQRAKQEVLKLMKEHKIESEDIRGYENVFGEGARPIQETRKVNPWATIRPSLDSRTLGSLNNLWYGGGELNPWAKSKLEAAYQQNPMGQTSFNPWVKQTLRQSFENATMGGAR